MGLYYIKIMFGVNNSVDVEGLKFKDVQFYVLISLMFSWLKRRNLKMEKIFNFIDILLQMVKIGDIIISFMLICGNDNMLVDLIYVNLIIVKLGNVSGYLKLIIIDLISLIDLIVG